MNNRISKTVFKENKNKSIQKLIKKIENNKIKSKYISGKLCKILKETDEKVVPLQTPFGQAKINTITGENEETEEFEINETQVKSGRWSKYINLADAIERFVPKKERLDSLNKIYKYLSISADWNIKSIEQFNDKVKKVFNVKNIIKKATETEDEKNKRLKNNSLTYLSAILMISEPFRFNDGGGLSRGAIRYMFVNLKNGNDNAISDALGSKVRNKQAHLLFPRKYGKKIVLNKIAENEDKDKLNQEAEDQEIKDMELGYVSNEDEDEDEKYKNKAKMLDIDIEKEIIRKAYQEGEIHIFSAIGKMNKLKNQSDKKLKFIGKKRFISKSKKRSTSLPKNKLKKIK